MDSTTLSIRQEPTIAHVVSEQSPVFIHSSDPVGVSYFVSKRYKFFLSRLSCGMELNLSQPNLGVWQTPFPYLNLWISDILLQSGGAKRLAWSGVIGGAWIFLMQWNFPSPVQSSAVAIRINAGKLEGAIKLTAGNQRLAYSGSFSADWNNNNFPVHRLQWCFVNDSNMLYPNQCHLLTSLNIFRNKPQAALSAGICSRSTEPANTTYHDMTSSDQHQWDQGLSEAACKWLYSAKNQSFTIRVGFNWWKGALSK